MIKKVKRHFELYPLNAEDIKFVFIPALCLTVFGFGLYALLIYIVLNIFA